MGDRHHYVPQFHLKGFADPSSTASPDPWLWIADCADGEIRRRAPKNLGWERDLYAVPGAFSSADARLEEYLAQKIEAPAAAALRVFSKGPAGSRGSIPGELMRYLSWAAARTPAMRNLYQGWIDSDIHADAPVAEAPIAWLKSATDRYRLHWMEHEIHGFRDDARPEDVAQLKAEGWRLLVNAEDFGELLHVQAQYFHDRFFPRLHWLILDAPDKEHFIIGDRPVVWGFAGAIDVPPAALRHPAAQLVAPLTRSLALVGFNPASESPTAIKVQDINRAVSIGAQDWIAGPTKPTVLAALKLRTSGFSDRAI